MRRFAAALAILALGSAGTNAAEDRLSTYFVLHDQRSGAFDEAVWRQASSGKDWEKFVHTYRNRNGDGLQAAKNDATAARVPDNVVVLLTGLIPAKTSREFQEGLRDLVAHPDFGKLDLLAKAPMCAVAQQKPGNYVSGLPASMMFVMDNEEAVAACYAFVQDFYTAPKGTDGKRPVPVVLDDKAVRMQEALPPMQIEQAVLADKNAYGQGRLVLKDPAIYAPGEEIFVIMNLANVGRDKVGTMDAKTNIQLGLEVRDGNGGVMESFPELHTFRFDSPTPFPLSQRYFSSHVTTSLSFKKAGDRTIILKLIDRSRPNSEPVSAELSLTVK